MTSQQLEEILTTHYSKLCSTLSDIDNLLPHFVTKKIININDLEEIKANAPSIRKVEKLMRHISGPLEAGNTEVFYIMLRIMKKYGHQATQKLADQIRKSLPTTDDDTESDDYSK